MKLISWLFESGRQRALRLAISVGVVLGGDVSDEEVLRAIRSVPCHYTGIAFDNAGNSGLQTGQTSYMVSVTINDGTNGFLAVDVDIFSTGQSVTSITSGAISCSFIGALDTATKRVECWGVTGVAAGTYTFTVQLAASLTTEAMWVSYTGVNQSAPTEALNTNSGSATANPNMVVTTLTDNAWVHAVLGAIALGGSPVSGQTARNVIAVSGNKGANADTNGVVHPAGAQTMNYTLGTSTWTMLGYGIVPVSAPAIPVLSDLAHSAAYRTVMAM